VNEWESDFLQKAAKDIKSTLVVVISFLTFVLY
jgi:hypothetical protein